MKAIYLNHTYLKLRNMGQTVAVVNFRRWMGQYVQDYECGSQLPSCIRNLWYVIPSWTYYIFLLINEHTFGSKVRK